MRMEFFFILSSWKGFQERKRKSSSHKAWLLTKYENNFGILNGGLMRLSSWALILTAGFSSVTAQAFDHRHLAWAKLVQAHVEQQGSVSKVDYAALKASPGELENYLASLTAVIPKEYETFSIAERLTFLINAYNAFTVKLIVSNYPLKSIKGLGSLFKSPWKKKFFQLLGEERSLDDVEHGIIRKKFNEPRIHLALVCASKGCPGLRAYTSSQLNHELDHVTRTFLTDPARNRWDPAANKLELSSIFKWYGDDFKKKHKTLVAFLSQYMVSDPAQQAKLAQSEPNISYLDYDWTLNSK